MPASPKSHFQKLTPPGVRASLRGAGGSQACDHLLSPISVRSLDSSGFDVLLTALLCSGPACHLGLAARHQPGSGEEEEEQQEPQQDAASPVVHPAHGAQLTLQTPCPPYKPRAHPTNPAPTLPLSFVSPSHRAGGFGMEMYGINSRIINSFITCKNKIKPEQQRYPRRFTHTHTRALGGTRRSWHLLAPEVSYI